MALLCLGLLGCQGNRPYQVSELEGPAPADSCDDAFQSQLQDGYELAFVEFTERGNVFRRDCTEHVLDLIEKRAGAGDTAVVVFVHGWRHNARSDDQNVVCFKQLLKSFAKGEVDDARSESCFDIDQFPKSGLAQAGPPLDGFQGALYGKKVLGVYVGWRGIPFRAGAAELATYWDRKKVAEEVGPGGATELLLRLERIVWRPEMEESPYDQQMSSRNRNVFLVIGHSFGGAIVLGALNDVLLERVISAQPLEGERCRFESEPDASCRITRPFGHGVVLLNPAIEANQIFQLKELVAARRFSRSQSRLLHVISTRADQATHGAFPLGQALGVGTSWRQAELWRRRSSGDWQDVDDGWLSLDEWSLDTATVGNFPGFRTGFLDASEKSEKDAPLWCYRSCVPDSFGEVSHDCVDPEEEDAHFPVRPFEPLAFIYADESFMSSHSDVFNPRVRAYLNAIVAESLNRRRELPEGLVESCGGDGNFGTCFEHFLEREKDYLLAVGRDPAALGGYASATQCEQEMRERFGREP